MKLDELWPQGVALAGCSVGAEPESILKMFKLPKKAHRHAKAACWGSTRA